LDCRKESHVVISSSRACLLVMSLEPKTIIALMRSGFFLVYGLRFRDGGFLLSERNCVFGGRGFSCNVGAQSDYRLFVKWRMRLSGLVLLVHSH
jgi:hypothetical protein